MYSSSMYSHVDIEIERVINRQDRKTTTTYVYLPMRSIVKTVAKVLFITYRYVYSVLEKSVLYVKIINI